MRISTTPSPAFYEISLRFLDLILCGDPAVWAEMRDGLGLALDEVLEDAQQMTWFEAMRSKASET